MTVFRAAWVLPVAASPICDGWVAVEGGAIRGVGAGRQSGSTDLGDVAVLPALVNAHTHLELSHLRGAIPPADHFTGWVRRVLAARQDPDAQDARVLAAAGAALQEARAAGTGLIGDISNTLATVGLLRESGVSARVFYEQIGFNPEDPAGRVRAARASVDDLAAALPDRVRLSLAPHAPYSVSASLFRAIRADLDAHPADLTSVHLSESPEEMEFLRYGTGEWRELLRELGVLPDLWRPPGCSTVTYLRELGFLDARALAVHAVQCSSDDLAALNGLGATIVSCPRSNRWVGVGDPPLDAFYASGVAVAFGTDSLASVGDLNLFAELARARAVAPRVAAHRLLESATWCGARALGFGDRLGTIEAGKQAALIAVRLPSGVGDVEEYLVNGVQPDAIEWLDANDRRS